MNDLVGRRLCFLGDARDHRVFAGNAVNAEEDQAVYGLPTEAEWEYACRAGTTTRWSFGDDAYQLGEYAWYGSNSGNMKHEVGGKLPNGWGLYDMYGNVMEWIEDGYGPYGSGLQVDPTGSVLDSRRAPGAPRVVRGGSFASVARAVRSTDRAISSPDKRVHSIGVRLLIQGP